MLSFFLIKKMALSTCQIRVTFRISYIEFIKMVDPTDVSIRYALIIFNVFINEM